MRDQAIGQPDVLSLAAVTVLGAAARRVLDLRRAISFPASQPRSSTTASGRRITRPAGEKNSADEMPASLLSASIHY